MERNRSKKAIGFLDPNATIDLTALDPSWRGPSGAPGPRKGGRRRRGRSPSRQTAVAVNAPGAMAYAPGGGTDTDTHTGTSSAAAIDELLHEILALLLSAFHEVAFAEHLHGLSPDGRGKRVERECHVGSGP